MMNVLQEAYGKLKIRYVTAMTPLLPVTTLMTKPVKSLGDLKGTKIRALGPIATWFSKLGSSPVSMPMAEIYMALKLGTIDGAATGMDVHTTNKTQEVCKYHILPNPVDVTPLNFLVNIEAWNGLSTADRDAITKAGREWSAWCVSSFDPGDLKATVDALNAANVQKIELSADDIAKMQATAVEVWDEFAKTDADTAKAIAAMKDYFKSTGRIK